jgi:hypothetical protein
MSQDCDHVWEKLGRLGLEEFYYWCRVCGSLKVNHYQIGNRSPHYVSVRKPKGENHETHTQHSE